MVVVDDRANRRTHSSSLLGLSVGGTSKAYDREDSTMNTTLVV